MKPIESYFLVRHHWSEDILGAFSTRDKAEGFLSSFGLEEKYPYEIVEVEFYG